MSVLNLTAPQDAEREAYVRFAREHADEAYRFLLRDLYERWHGYNRDYFGGRLVRRPGSPGVQRFMDDLLLAETVCQAVRELEGDDVAPHRATPADVGNLARAPSRVSG